MLILGISDLERDPTVALVNETGVLAAIEERKLGRNPTNESFPNAALDWCLKQVDRTVTDITHIAAVAGAEGTDPLTKWSTLSPEARQVDYFDHHLSHAASAFYPSAFRRALVLVLDHNRGGSSGVVALGDGRELTPLRHFDATQSLGFVYSEVTGSLGFRQRADEHKTQWLSTHGAPDYLAVFSELFSSKGKDLPTLNPDYLGRNGNGFFLNERLFKKLGGHSDGFTDRGQRTAIARSLQEHVEQTVLGLVEFYRKQTGARHLCLAGGVFLNSLLVQALEERSGFDEIFVQPAAGNPGTALGVAYLSLASGTGERPPAMPHLFLGPQASDHEVKSVLDNCKVVYRFLRFEHELINETVRLLSKQKAVAWHQGRMELGHRALGNRSILASPFSPFVKENLNEFIKHREDFHPFILSVPVEDASRFFSASSNCAFATSLGTVREDIHDFDHLMFSGRHVRLHLVSHETNPRYWELLQAFGKGAPAPVLVNTSFNLFGEPLVGSPRDAIRTFYCSGLDALVVGDFVVLKR